MIAAADTAVIPWDAVAHMFGHMSDPAIAAHLSTLTGLEITAVRVARHRQRRGILGIRPRGRPSPVAWEVVAPDLGDVPDKIIAERTGLDVSLVAAARRRLVGNRHFGIDWSEQYDLGMVPDADLATRLGVKVSTVQRARLRYQERVTK